MIDNNYFEGVDELLYIDFGDGFFPIGALTSNSFSESVEAVESTTRDNQGWKTHRLTLQEYSISFSGLIMNTIYAKGDFNKISYDRLTEIKRDRKIIDWKTQSSDQIFIHSGQAQITEISKESNVGEYISFSATLLGYGAPANTTGKSFNLSDGNSNLIQDGNNKIISS